VKSKYPGFSRDKTLILPIPPDAWPPPTDGLTLDGSDFEPKSELHVTILGSEYGAYVHDAVKNGFLREADFVRAFERQPWGFARTGEYRLLARDKQRDDGTTLRAKSIVAMLSMSSMQAFHYWLAARLGIDPIVPPPHVTLWVSGDRNGIGLTCEEDLAESTVLVLDRGQLPLD
ncbi:MAG TPA: hypothetical protein VFO79_14650, partial [Xanthomonadales bacterium]|nr:hypothetical protein [Xanthomonadales bacterium]